MIKSIKIRIFPNKEQEQLLWKHTNASRFIWYWDFDNKIENILNNQN